jgi:hypothetical protein
MRKFIVACLLAVLALGAVPALATPVADLTALAEQFPDTTVIFAVVRTDDGYIETLDGVIGRARDLLPSGTIPPVRLSTLLDQAFMEMANADFREGVRPWLGDTAAFGLTSLDMTTAAPPIMLALAVKDRAGAEAFLDSAYARALENDWAEKVDENGLTIYRETGDYASEMLIALSDSILFITGGTIPAAPESPLSGSDTFQSTLAALPQSDYNIVAYMNTPALMDFALAMSARFNRNIPEAFGESMSESLAGFMDAAGPVAVGLTILAGPSLVMDVAQMMGDTTALTEAGFDLTMPATPVDPAFAAFIPADAPLVMQGTEVNTAVTTGLQNLRAFGAFIQEQARQMPDSAFTDEADKMLREFNAGAVMASFFSLSFTGATGLTLDDVLPWMDGDFAAYLRVQSLPEETGEDAAPDFAALVESSDPAGPLALLDALETSLQNYGVSISRETVGSGEALVLQSPMRHMFRPRVAERLAGFADMDILIGASDQLFIAGSRAAVTASLAAGGDMLADSPAYQEALEIALDGAQQLWFLNTRAFVPFIDEQLGRLDASTFRINNMREMRALAGLLSSGSISVVVAEDGAMVARFALTLAQEPLD